jgi:hypothetical protein
MPFRRLAIPATVTLASIALRAGRPARAGGLHYYTIPDAVIVGG